MTSEISERVQLGCDIATAKQAIDPAALGTRITGAKKDLSAKGRGPEWYRMVRRGTAWMYVSDERLPHGNYLAADRRATVYGEVYTGEIVVQHDRGGPVDAAWLVIPPDAEGKVLLKLDAPATRRDGQISVTLPDGSVIVLPNPRKK